MSRHYNFIEIGTSNFNTLLEQAGPDTVGLSVECLQEYLNDLPNRPNVEKLCCAISDKDGTLPFFYIPKEIVAKYNMGSRMCGCNSVGEIHPRQLDRAAMYGVDVRELVRQIDVPCMTFVQLVAERNIAILDLLKIDTEGHDCTILNNAFWTIVQLKTKRIVFEYNALTDKEQADDLFKRFAARGYSAPKFYDDNVELNLISCD